MIEAFTTLAGTEEGARLALILTLISAFLHAVFGALNKEGFDPYLNRGAINVFYSLVAAPIAIFVFPLPAQEIWPILFLSFVFHIAYEWMQSEAYVKGDFTLVYPIARGTGPLLTAVIAIAVFQETLSIGQWFGMLLLSGAIISLAGVNLRESGKQITSTPYLLPTILFAMGAGFAVALYTIVDAYGIREVENPFTYLIWFYFLGGMGFPVIAYFRWRRMETKPPISPLVKRGVIGGTVALFSFATLMLATRIGNVGQAAALRETSIIFATIIGVMFFKESVSRYKLTVIGFIVLGAVMIELA